MCVLERYLAANSRGWAILLLFPVTGKVRDYTCQNSNYITVTDLVVMLRYWVTKAICFLSWSRYDNDMYVHVPIYICLQEAYLI